MIEAWYELEYVGDTYFVRETKCKVFLQWSGDLNDELNILVVNSVCANLELKYSSISAMTKDWKALRELEDHELYEVKSNCILIDSLSQIIKKLENEVE